VRMISTIHDATIVNRGRKDRKTNMEIKKPYTLEVRHPRCVVELQEQVIGTYVCSQKHNYISYITFTITTVQLHVSAINVGHLQVVHEAPYDKLYLHLSGGYSLWGGVGARSRFVFVKGMWIGSI